MKAENKGGAEVIAIVILVVILIAVGYCISISDQSGGSSSQPTRKTSNISEYRISGDGWFGCTEREQLSNLIRYTSQQDKDAFKQELALGLTLGTCTQFEEGEIV